MTILAGLYLFCAYAKDGREAKVPPILLTAPFIDIVVIVGWFVSIV